MTTTKTSALNNKTPAITSVVPASGSSAASASGETAEMPTALAAMMSEDEAVAAQAEAARWKYGFFVVLTGLVVVLVAFVVVALRNGDTAAPFAGLVGVAGAIIGAYFGVQVGQSGKDRVEAELRRANEVAIRLAAKVHAHDADAVINTTMGPRRR
ncbi:hypothetical protein GCM10010517_50610 [Streptosporangium fragile]|uniref:Holin-X, holin superfamily III n=1 Tax=Streptosporangium fragile TaxID=46186 RepID=A0ABN3W1Z1_9ACTN